MPVARSSGDNQGHSRPSKRIKEATVKLLGLSYGEYDGGVLRAEQSAIIAEVIHLWTSGLLAADFGQPEVDATTAEFDHFMHSPPAPDLLDWSLVPIPTLNELITIHCTLASQFISNLSVADDPPPPERLPPQRAACAFAIVQRLLGHMASVVDDPVRLVASTEAVSHFLYSAGRLRASVSEYSELGDTLCENIPSITKHFCLCYQQQSETNLMIHVLPSVVNVTASVVRSEAEMPSPHHALESLMLAPALASLAAMLKVVGNHNKLNSVTKTILDALLHTVDHVYAGSRVATLDLLSYLNSVVPNSFLAHASQLSERLPSAMLWRDPASTTRAVALLHDVLPNLSGGNPPPLSQDPPKIWQAATSAMMKTLNHHVEGALTGGPGKDSESDTMADHADAAVSFAPLVIQTFRHRILLCAGAFFTDMARLLPRLVSLAASQRVAAYHLVSLSAAIETGISYAWARIPAYRSPLFAACVEAVLESRFANDTVQMSAQTSALTIVTALASVNPTPIIRLAANSRRVAEKYKSLAKAVDFLRDAEVIVQGLVPSHKDDAINETNEEAEGNYGPLISQFYGRKL